jgi:signal transduction histidine kinase
VKKSTRDGFLSANMLHIVAHDLRNPISGILAASEYLIENLPQVEGEEHTALLQAIYSSSRSTLQLIDDVVEILATDHGTDRFHFAPTDLMALVEQNVALNRALARQKGIELHLTGDSAIPLLPLDPKKILQAIDSLLKNTIGFSVRNSTIEIGVHKQADVAVLSVRQQGRGIPAREPELERAPFRKGRVVEPRLNIPQTGLWLAVIARIVEAHGGQVRLQSGAGKNVFTVSLPIVAQSSSRTRWDARRRSVAGEPAASNQPRGRAKSRRMKETKVLRSSA